LPPAATERTVWQDPIRHEDMAQWWNAKSETHALLCTSCGTNSRNQRFEQQLQLTVGSHTNCQIRQQPAQGSAGTDSLPRRPATKAESVSSATSTSSTPSKNSPTLHSLFAFLLLLMQLEGVRVSIYSARGLRLDKGNGQVFQTHCRKQVLSIQVIRHWGRINLRPELRVQ
jgi:hypothetical protein